MDLVAVDSTMLSAVGYDSDARELEAVSTDGAIWRYRDVPEQVYRELLASDSIGSYMRECIIDEYADYPVQRGRR